MPLVKPEIQKVLRAAGLQDTPVTSDESTVSEKLDAAGLDLTTIAEELFHLAKNSGNESLRLRALETGLKAHGALKETAAAPPSFTLIIQPSSFSPPSNVSQIVNLPEGVNPILLPRQLHTQLLINKPNDKDVS